MGKKDRKMNEILGHIEPASCDAVDAPDLTAQIKGLTANLAPEKIRKTKAPSRKTVFAAIYSFAALVVLLSVGLILNSVLPRPVGHAVAFSEFKASHAVLSMGDWDDATADVKVYTLKGTEVYAVIDTQFVNQSLTVYIVFREGFKFDGYKNFARMKKDPDRAGGKEYRYRLGDTTEAHTAEYGVAQFKDGTEGYEYFLEMRAVLPDDRISSNDFVGLISNMK
ncbi:hypothetical protein FACS1894211_01830 [Clostridia bacterium]|nr:hypothetical protein FACS1894211_01830 [Clostridia bacterium]